MKRSVQRASFASALVAVFVVLGTSPARGALPPAYGGVAVLPAQGRLALPDPLRRDTPLDAALAHAVYDGLYEFPRGGRPRPLLAVGEPVRVRPGVFHIRLRDGLRVHGGGTLRARDVVATLERVRGSGFGWLLAGVREAAVVEDEPNVVEVRTRIAARALARVLGAAPLAVTSQRRVLRGTGPFVAAVRPNGHLHLRGVRAAPRGAPYLSEVRVVPARPGRAEARAFELGELHASFQGSSVYGGRPAPNRQANVRAPVLLIPNRSNGPLASSAARAAVEGAIDRERLARVGLDGAPRLAEGLEPWTHAGAEGARGSGRLRVVVRAGDEFQRRVADALAAQLDERGFRVVVTSLRGAAMSRTVRSGDWDLRLATIAPILPGRWGLTASAFAATGQLSRAQDLARRGLAVNRAVAASPEVAAWVLGRRVHRVHYRRTVHGVAFDRLGRLKLDALYRPREVIRGGG